MSFNRVHNFNPGPAVLPLEVLKKAQAEFLDYQGNGMSLLEMSHRSAGFEAVLARCEADLRELLNIPSNYKVLFQQGGASLQFAMVPMNLRAEGKSADYTLNGSWGKAAIKDAQKLGKTRVTGSTEGTNFDRIPGPELLDYDSEAAYFHFTSNETIHGIEWQQEPNVPANVPLVCDMSSNILSRPLDVSRYGLIYGGAQKNAGPSGVTIVIVREDLLERSPANLPVMLSYAVQANAGSMHNTPPTFSIYLVGLVLEWLKGIGGIPEMYKRNQHKAGLVYKAIDTSGGFYRGHAQADSRSLMNITFRLPSEDLEKQFAKEAQSAGMVGLKGHRSVGGMRASTYNALPVEATETLAQFMQEFQRKNG